MGDFARYFKRRLLRVRGALLLMSVAAVIAAVVVIGAYAAKLGGPLSSRGEDWAQFGEYVGGLLGPLFALFALLGLLWTIDLQRQTMEEARTDRVLRTVFDLADRLEQLRARPLDRPGPLPQSTPMISLI
ncbi:MAG TPA: hypothetical protein VFA39_10500 [Steroidobacteraceae bacterium]|nr:hypothetical protein [Steroidobacteraceae bacterium]